VIHPLCTRPRTLLVLATLSLVLSSGWAALSELADGTARKAADRARAKKLLAAGNVRESFEISQRLALDADTSPSLVAGDLKQAILCLGRLGRTPEIDAMRDRSVLVHRGNWRLLLSAATSLSNGVHSGRVVAGEFQRGNSRGRGQSMSSFSRDRSKALGWLEQALLLVVSESQNRKDAGRVDRGRFYIELARIIMQGREAGESWKLAILTDPGSSVDLEQSGFGFYRGRFSGTPRGAPVDELGRPLFHAESKTYQAATSDGQRWRWSLAEAVRANPDIRTESLLIRARFLLNQFGVQTMRHSGIQPRRTTGKDDDLPVAGPWSVGGLSETETIARLAGGVKRFDLPAEHNHIALLGEAARAGRGASASQSADLLAGVFENRQQYVSAAAAWREAIERFGPGNNSSRRKKLEQIINGWGQFETAHVSPVGSDTSVDFRFRNGSELTLEVFHVRVDQLLNDVKVHLRRKAIRVDYNSTNVENIGYRLMQQDQQKYVGQRIRSWTHKLNPRPGHQDRLVTISTGLKQAGCYLLTARMTGGNHSRIVIWKSDTALVHKRIGGGDLYFVADAVSGSPVAGAKVEFFGYEQNRIGKNQYEIKVSEFSETTDAQGQVVPRPTDPRRRLRWLVVARTADGRRAYMGFRSAWSGRHVSRVFERTRVYAITDRPVYRPGQSVKFKFWIRQARYDKNDISIFSGRKVTIQVSDPRNQEVAVREFTTDDFGGFDGELKLAGDANLGNYSIRIVRDKSDLTFGVNKRVAGGGGTFRVEEYKKPEYEVTIEAPDRPVTLGETITATVRAKYYFGGPVVKATVRVRVLRESHSDHWYPTGRWDWLYGPGYWWFASEYDWYPGWRVWGCRGPMPTWFGRSHQPPELVMENEVELGEDGTVELKIDTSLAKRFHPDTDHRYRITAEVVDRSRRTIVGTGSVMAARQPFRVTTWVDRGFYRTGETIRTSAQARTLDGRTVSGKARFVLYRINYDKQGQPKEKTIRSWDERTDTQGRAAIKLLATDAGQYRIACEVEDADGRRIEGAHLFVVRGPEFDGKDFRFNDLELTADRREYQPGQVARLMLNTNRRGSTVLLFVRAEGGVYPRPRLVKMKGKSTEIRIPIGPGDRPNIFVEAITVSGGKLHSAVCELFVPPETRVVHVDVKPSSKEYRPGAPATLDVALTDAAGKPFEGSLVLTMYDKSVEYISGGSNVAEIRKFFWNFRRSHYPQTTSNLTRHSGNLLKRGEVPMMRLGVFGDLVATQTRGRRAPQEAAMGGVAKGVKALGMAMEGGRASADADGADSVDAGDGGQMAAATLRSEFADTALWVGSVTTDKNGHARLTLDMPENLTTWSVRAWAMGHGTNVGEGMASVLTTKNVLVRLQAPRFFTETDEVVVSAIVHNYLDDDKTALVRLELDGGTLSAVDPLEKRVQLPAGGEVRVDWRVRVTAAGEAIVRMAALTDVESDAMELTFPVHVHGMQKTVSGTGVLRGDRQTAVVELTVPMARRPEKSRLEIRYTPTLAGAMVDALPYLVDFEYGCTEQTLNRFLPTVITHNLLKRMKIDLESVRKKRTNLNAGELGEGAERAQRWKRWKRNPVFDNAAVTGLVKQGVKALADMQLADGGWGWFSGHGEQSSAHTTATVVHGLSIALANDVAIPPGVYENGVAWLKRHQARQVLRLKNAPTKTKPYKLRADNTDALVFRVLVEADVLEVAMSDFLYRDRVQLSVYAKGLVGLAYHSSGQQQRLAMIIRNIDQFLQQDDENQTAWLQLPESTRWWRWYGNEVEANAIYLKLLALTDPKGVRASRLVKYLLNNRRHATYWNSTRDTALCIESLAEYMDRSGESTPDVTIDVLIDGKVAKSVKVDAANLFSFDNAVVIEGDALSGGKHTVEIRRKGEGSVYFNTWLSYFTTEDFIGKAGLEIKVQRKYYRLVRRKDATSDVAGGRGQVLKQDRLVYDRQRVEHLGNLTSGDLVEIELEIESKNDYEYLVFEDPKAAGFEPVDRQSGYTGGYPRVYRQLRDDRVVFFFRALNRGRHSISYRMRAEIPGRFSALPTRGSAMYAPELKANSDEIRLGIADRK